MPAKRYSILLAVCLWRALVPAQNEADSLKRLAAGAKDDSTRTSYIIRVARHYYMSGATDSALRYGNLALKTGQAAKSKSLQSASYSVIGITYYYAGDYKNALTNYLSCLKLEEELGRKPRIAKMYNNIGTLYMDQKFYELAETQFSKSYALWKELNDTSGLVQVTNNLGVMYGSKSQQEGDTGTAAGYLKKAIRYNTETHKLATLIGDSVLIVHALSNLGQNYMYSGNYKAALVNFRQALAIERRMERPREAGISLLQLADVLARMRDHRGAIQCLEEALTLGSRINNPEIRKYAFMNMAENYGQLGNFRMAFESHKRFTALSDSMLNTESSRQLHELQVRFDTEKKEKENALLLEKNSSAAKTIRQQRVIGISIGLICVLLAGLALMIFRSNREKQRINLQLERKNLEIEKQKELVEEKQKEILDSIRYARRIQRSLLTSEKYIERSLGRLGAQARSLR
jgi:tetratricopeptide (TPR) repeat protein